MSDDERALLRRQFFRALLGKAVQPLAQNVEERLDAIQRVAAESMKSAQGKPAPSPPAPAPVPPPAAWIRPPGAMAEESFFSVCQRSGHCVEACPVAAIQIARDTDAEHDGLPYIDPEIQACVLCEDLPCISACPSGALLATERAEVRMGKARFEFDICLRSEGDYCEACVDVCPIGETAIVLDDEDLVAILDGCVGCGMCTMECPTSPKAIVIEPPGAQ